MAPHGHFPRTNQPEQPYDWAVPYDWAIEEVLDGPRNRSLPAENAHDAPWPYDQLAPYDWSLEGIFGHERRGSDVWLQGLHNLKDAATLAGAVVLTTVAMGALSAFIGNSTESDSVINAQNIPAVLPPKVKPKVAAAVKVEYQRNLDETMYGSGVKIGPDTVLTAGHIVLDGNPDGRLICDGSHTLSKLQGLYAYGGWQQQILGQKAVFNTSNYSAGQDAAVLRVERNQDFDSLPTVNVADGQPDEGEAVFFINFESGGPDSNEEHYPYQGFAGRSIFGGEKYDHHPAEYAGNIIGRQGSYLLVATGEASYGPRLGREFNTYPGASGGEVLNSNGDLIGLSVATMLSGESVRQIKDYYGLQLPEPRIRQISIIQPITKAILRPYLSGIPKTPVC